MVLFAQSFWQTRRLFAEKQRNIAPHIHLMVGAGRLGGGKVDIFITVLLKELFQIFIDADIHQMPVVKTAALDHFVRNIKAQRLDKVELCTCCGTGSGDGTGIVGYFRFNKDNIDHSVAPSPAAMPQELIISI